MTTLPGLASTQKDYKRRKKKSFKSGETKSVATLNMKEVTPREAEEELSEVSLLSIAYQRYHITQQAIVSAITPVVSLCDTSLSNIFASQKALGERMEQLDAVLKQYNPEVGADGGVKIPSFDEHTKKVCHLILVMAQVMILEDRAFVYTICTV